MKLFFFLLAFSAPLDLGFRFIAMHEYSIQFITGKSYRRLTKWNYAAKSLIELETAGDYADTKNLK